MINNEKKNKRNNNMYVSKQTANVLHVDISFTNDILRCFSHEKEQILYKMHVCFICLNFPKCKWNAAYTDRINILQLCNTNSVHVGKVD